MVMVRSRALMTPMIWSDVVTVLKVCREAVDQACRVVEGYDGNNGKHDSDHYVQNKRYERKNSGNTFHERMGFLHRAHR